MNFKAKAEGVIKTCNEYGFMGRDVRPYGWKMTVADLVRNWLDYDKCTRSSQQILESELRGFLPILDGWVAYQKEPVVKVRMLVGKNAHKVMSFKKSTAETFVECEMAEYM